MSIQNIEDILTELEREQTWRYDEIRFFQNQSTQVSDVRQNQFRRVIILLLYAHFEGFCKFAFTLYVNNINAAHIKCEEANYAIAAASLSDLFNALQDSDRKCSVFRNALPEETKIHKFARQRDFLEQSDEFDNRIVRISETLVDTESNLKPIVLQKILYRLGFPHDRLNSVDGEINQLLNYRNKIAHGESTSGIDVQEYFRLRDASFNIMNEVKKLVSEALQERHYLRQSSR
jgi:RiboL-PSP-HEPN